MLMLPESNGNTVNAAGQVTPVRSARVIIGILTAKNYQSRRDAVLATWARDAAAHPEVDFVFLIGDPKIKAPRREGDCLYLPCPDDYESLPQKTRWFCLWALTHGGQWQWLFKCDDDTYVRIDRLMLGQWDKPVVGCKDGDGRHWHGGAGYLINRDAAQAIAARLVSTSGFEDQLARDAIRASGLWFRHDPRFCYDRARIPSLQNDQITCHYANELWMRLIHDSFRSHRPCPDVAIPRTIHHIWVGDAPVPAHLEKNRQSWITNHPHWTFRLWEGKGFRDLVNQREFELAKTPAQKCQIARFEVLQREGGVYVDWDVESLRPLDELMAYSKGFAAAEDEDIVGIAVLGAVPKHPLLERVIQDIPHRFGKTGDPAQDTGSWFFTKHALSDPEWHIYSWQTFYPIHHSGFPLSPVEEAHARHFWEGSWKRRREAPAPVAEPAPPPGEPTRS